MTISKNYGTALNPDSVFAGADKRFDLEVLLECGCASKSSGNW